MNNIKELLKEEELIIPEIQRDYVWGDNELVIKRFINNIKNMTNVATAMSTALTLVPRPSEWSNSFIVAPSFVRTIKMPMSERKMPMAAIIIGAMTARSCISPFMAKAVAPRAAVDSIEPQ